MAGRKVLLCNTNFLLYICPMQTAKEPTVDSAQLVPVSQYALDKNVSRQTVHNWIANGTVKSRKIGKYYFVVVA